MSSGYLSVGTEKLHYTTWGNGSELLLAVHGYGDNATVFDPLQPYLSGKYTVISVDMPYHGESEWRGGRLSRKAFCEAIRQLISLHIAPKISLLGYSMGGRICLSLLESMPDAIDKVVLLAPDGLAYNPYYHFFTQTAIGKKAFNNMLDRPGKYLKVIEWLKKKGLVSPPRYKFAMHFLQEEEDRQFLQKAWPNTSEFVPSQRRLRAAIRKYSIPVLVIMGAGDRVIPPAQAKKFSAGVPTVQVHILDKGHRVFDNENAQQIAGYLL